MLLLLLRVLPHLVVVPLRQGLVQAAALVVLVVLLPAEEVGRGADLHQALGPPLHRGGAAAGDRPGGSPRDFSAARGEERRDPAAIPCCGCAKSYVPLGVGAGEEAAAAAAARVKAAEGMVAGGGNVFGALKDYSI